MSGMGSRAAVRCGAPRQRQTHQLRNAKDSNFGSLPAAASDGHLPLSRQFLTVLRTRANTQDNRLRRGQRLLAIYC